MTSTQQSDLGGEPAAQGPPVHRRLTYVPALEGIRGLALVGELLTHLGIFVVPSAMAWLLPGGLTVMSIFFVLSGFFITLMLLKSHERYGKIDIWGFWKRRAIRLYPPILLVLSARWLLVMHYNQPVGTEWKDDLLIIFNLMDYRYAITGDPALGRAALVIFWSVAVEVQFYIIWPFVVHLLVKYMRSLRRIIWALVALAGASIAVRVIEYRIWNDWLAVYYRFEGWLDAFAVGAILAFLWSHNKIPVKLFRRLSWPCIMIFAASFWLLTPESAILHSIGFTVFSVASMVLIGSFFGGDTFLSKCFSTRFMCLAGQVSYSFYLIHIQVYMWVVMQRQYLPAFQKAILALGGALLFGTIGYLIAERPFVKPRRSRPRSRGSTAVNSQ